MRHLLVLTYSCLAMIADVSICASRNSARIIWGVRTSFVSSFISLFKEINRKQDRIEEGPTLPIVVDDL